MRPVDDLRRTCLCPVCGPFPVRMSRSPLVVHADVNPVPPEKVPDSNPSLAMTEGQIGAWTQPTAASQLSAVHELPSSHWSALPEVHSPATQVSAPLQTVGSAHEVPSGTEVCPQIPAVQASTVQGEPSSHSAALWQPGTTDTVAVARVKKPPRCDET